MKAVLIDGYVDEPAVLGVPPYISPYVRYAYGVLLSKNVDVLYLTVDELRKREEWRFDVDLLIVYGGTTVPGHYLSGTPLTLSELSKILSVNSHTIRIVSGPITRSYSIKGGTMAIKPKINAEYIVRGDLWAFLKGFLEGEVNTAIRGRYEDMEEIAVYGSELVAHHPMFPNVICEIEVSRGCERSSFCSFCMEPILYGRLRSRRVEEVLKEVEALYNRGCRAFRLGRTANILAYMSDFNAGIPSPKAIEELYSGLRSVAPNLEVLHTDNANPSYLVRYAKEGVEILETIARYNTPGDVLSFGAESFDEKVIKLNNIGSSPEEVFEAVRMVNEIGGIRVEGVPKLLPGINILHGLIGEDEGTYKKNYTFLKKILGSGLLLRRINIRQVIVHPGTPLFGFYSEKKRFRIRKDLFKYWKSRIRREIDHPMLKKVFPKGSIIRGVIPEKKKGNLTFGRPLGTYPILVGTRSNFQEKSDFVVVDHGERSLTALKLPVNLNELSYEELISIDGIGERRVKEILLKRPFKDLKDARRRLSKETWVSLIDVLMVKYEKSRR